MQTESLKYFKKVDPALFAIAKDENWYLQKRKRGYLAGLCRIIIGQQLSVKAANSIYTRFADLFPRNIPRPELILKTNTETLRAAGLSLAKCLSIKHLSELVLSRELPLNKLRELGDEEVIERLTKVRGIGPWSAEMFLMSYLDRPDIFSAGDLGLRTAIQKLYNLEGVPTPVEASSFAERWSPFRSYACRLLWHSLNNNPDN